MELSELNKAMQSQLKKRDTYKQGIATLFELRDRLADTIISFREEFTDGQFSAIPFINTEGYHSKTVAY